jgi:sugar phosphate isomerase/epimerase
MDFGLCAGAAANAELAAGMPGLDFLEENVQGFLVPAAPEADFIAKLAAARAAQRPIVAANCFLPASLPCVGPAVDDAAIDAWAANAFRRAEATGIRVIVFGSGGSRKIPDGFAATTARDQFATLLARLGPVAARHGVTVVVEPLNRGECNFINTVAEGADVVREVRHPNVRLLADLYHMAKNGETATDLAPVVPLLAHVHIAEVATRSAPGVAGDDFTAFFTILRAGGYDARISLECNWGDLAKQAAPGLAETRRQFAAVAAVADALKARVSGSR